MSDEPSEPIITFNNRTLRVEHDGWYLEVKVLASGRQIAVRVAGDAPTSNDLIIRPDVGNRVFISSGASEKEDHDAEPGRSDPPVPRTARQSGGAKR